MLRPPGPTHWPFHPPGPFSWHTTKPKGTLKKISSHHKHKGDPKGKNYICSLCNYLRLCRYDFSLVSPLVMEELSFLNLQFCWLYGSSDGWGRHSALVGWWCHSAKSVAHPSACRDCVWVSKSKQVTGWRLGPRCHGSAHQMRLCSAKHAVEWQGPKHPKS